MSGRGTKAEISRRLRGLEKAAGKVEGDYNTVEIIMHAADDIKGRWEKIADSTYKLTMRVSKDRKSSYRE